MTQKILDATPLAPNEQITPRQQDLALAELQGAVEALDHALSSLRELSKQPGYDFVEKLLPGYEWASEQIGELNTSLIFRDPSKPGASE